jgi:hypothetical protein
MARDKQMRQMRHNRRGSLRAYCLLPIAPCLLFGCGGTPPAGPSPASSAPATAPTPATAAVYLEPFVPPLERWSDFFVERFGGEPTRHWVGEFKPDGVRDLAVELAGRIVIFHETAPKLPTTWSALTLPTAGATIANRASRWAIEQLPELKGALRPEQNVFVIGDKSPLIVFWSFKEDAYAALQAIPAPLAAAERDARAKFPGAFGISKNNLIDEKGAAGESPLSQYFVGDFDADGEAELAVIDAQQIHRYTAAAAAPITQPLSYPARRGVIHVAGDAKKPSEAKGDFIELSIPETSSIDLVFRDGKWQEIFVSD